MVRKRDEKTSQVQVNNNALKLDAKDKYKYL